MGLTPAAWLHPAHAQDQASGWTITQLRPSADAQTSAPAAATTRPGSATTDGSGQPLYLRGSSSFDRSGGTSPFSPDGTFGGTLNGGADGANGLRGSATSETGQAASETTGDAAAGPASVVDFDRSSSDDTAPQDAAADPDYRLKEDRDAFENPPAGHDPRYFGIDINPLTDRRTRVFFEDDAFPHIGWKIGSFVLFQEFQIGPGWDSNVFLASDARGDWFADLMSETRLVSDWTRHAVELRMTQNRRYQDKYPKENDNGQIYDARGRLDITSRTNIEASLRREYSQDSPNSIDAEPNSTRRADITTDTYTGVVNHRFNRLSLRLRGAYRTTRYTNDPGDPRNDRDVDRKTVAVRAQWEFRPTFSVFGEVEHQERNHKAATLTDNIKRDSAGEGYRAGISLGQTGDYLRGEASIGIAQERPKANRLPTFNAFLVDANIAWRVTSLTSLLFEASTNVDETTVANSPGVVSRRAGVRVRHAFTDRFVGETGVSYSVQNYQNVDLTERDTRFDALLEYTVNRHLAFFTRTSHDRFRSTEPNRDYNASQVYFGARIRN